MPTPSPRGLNKLALKKIVQRIPYKEDTGWSEPVMYFDLLECGHARTSLPLLAPKWRYLCATCQRTASQQKTRSTR